MFIRAVAIDCFSGPGLWVAAALWYLWDSAQLPSVDPNMFLLDSCRILKSSMVLWPCDGILIDRRSWVWLEMWRLCYGFDVLELRRIARDLAITLGTFDVYKGAYSIPFFSLYFTEDDWSVPNGAKAGDKRFFLGELRFVDWIIWSRGVWMFENL